MDTKKIKNLLKTKWLGHELYFQDKISSTNSWAKEKKDKKRGDVFLANQQIQGRGRLNRSWESISGKDLIFSFLDECPKNISDLSIMSLLVGISLWETLEQLYSHLEFSLKWPNDILLKEKKLGGILIELCDDFLVIGIGLNVNHSSEELSSDIQNLSISLFDIEKENQDREEILVRFFAHYEFYRKLLDEGQSEQILEKWRAVSSSLHRNIKVNLPTGVIQGRARDINGLGHLMIETKEGLEEVSLGDVSY